MRKRLIQRIINFLWIDLVKVNGRWTYHKIYTSTTMDIIEFFLWLWIYICQAIVWVKNTLIKWILFLLIGLLWLIPFGGNVAALDRAKLFLTWKKERVGRTREQEDAIQKIDEIFQDAPNLKDYYPQYGTFEEQRAEIQRRLENFYKNEEYRKKELQEWMDNYSLTIDGVKFLFKRKWYHDNYKVKSVKRVGDNYVINFVDYGSKVSPLESTQRIAELLPKELWEKVLSIDTEKALSVPMMAKAVEEFTRYNPERYERDNIQLKADIYNKIGKSFDESIVSSAEADIQRVMERANNL